MRKRVVQLVAHPRPIVAGQPPVTDVAHYTRNLNRRGAHRGMHVISTPWAIIIAGALIAAAIALTNHWSFDPGPQGGTATLLNRWTGRVIVCGGHVLPGWEIPCPVPAEIPK